MAAKTDTGHRWADRGRYRAEPFAEPARKRPTRRRATPVLAQETPRTTAPARQAVAEPVAAAPVSGGAVPPPVPATSAVATPAAVKEHPKSAATSAPAETKPTAKAAAEPAKPKATEAKPEAKKPSLKKSEQQKPEPKAEVAERTQRNPETGLLKIVEDGRRPVVVVENLHVKYKVFSSGKASGAKGSGGLLKRGVRGLREVHALKGISFVAYENESIGILGSNGSGKSTLLRAITGLTPPAEGAVYASSRPNLLGVGAALIPSLSGNANITLGCLALGFTREEVEELRPEIIAFSELEEFIDLPMNTYSSGMSARLKFAIASSKQHDILIVDEALAVGDARFRKRSEARIREIRENAGTVFMVSHSMKSIRDTCSRAIWIEKGVQKMDGDVDKVVKAYEASRK